MGKYIPAETLTVRLEKIQAKISGFSQQIEDLKREEKILIGLLEDAVEAEDGKPVQAREVSQPTRAKGVVEAIVGFIQTKPGASRDDLVEALKYLNLNPFDQNAARRTILNNLGNLIRTGRIQADEVGKLTLIDSKQSAVG